MTGEYIATHLDYVVISVVAMPVIILGIGLIVRSLIVKHPVPMSTAENAVVTDLKAEVSLVVSDNNEVLNALKVKSLPNSQMNQAIDVVIQENLDHVTSIHNKIETIVSTVSETNSMLNFGVNCVFMGLAFIACTMIFKNFNV